MKRMSGMEPALVTHLLAAATATLAAVALAVFGLTQRGYSGLRWWQATLWLNAGVLALSALIDDAAVASVTQPMLLVAWPLLTLRGFRGFHARTPLPGAPLLDIAVLGVLLVTALAAAPATALDAGAVSLYAAVAAAAYVAAVLFAAPAGPERDALRLMAVAVAAIGAMTLATALKASASATAAAWPGAAVALGSLLTAFAALLLSTQRTERDLRESRRKFRALANLDMLTQVPNRRRFEELAQRALQTDEPGSATLLLLDIDHFKQINDRLGHAAGDRALKLVSRCTQELLRSEDVAGRHGGDEFVLLLRRSSTQDAMLVAQRLVGQLQARSHAHALPRLSLSFGIVQMRPGEGIDETLQRADLALYEAKRLGRCRAVAADGDDDEHPVFHSSQRLGLTSS